MATVEGVKFPSARQPVWMRDQSGAPVFTRPWFLFLQALWSRQGGASAPDVDTIADDFAQSPTLGEQAVLGVMIMNELIGDVAALRAEVAELNKEIQALRQGTLI